ncbi:MULTISPECIES: glutamate--cysteine ligase [Halomonadaceae]|uniref:Glutamate--cysteine ligase n=1 Tax=Vreelandella halophila TaxID=86177 RepID=A0A9X5B576_9GAMM|nr:MULTISPECIES: glutamate--cysteine ligase [Halomonas]MYL26143.1 glutamate--cysteine ligase [Halomonas utahensis]MYL73295.1 glutamate--cysteine ligase [Halomonas sp. 22501_18_FS]
MGERRFRALESIAGGDWPGFRKGLEKEGLRVDPEGAIARTPHPEALGSALTNPAITTDYSESLLELVTPVCESTAELMAAIEGIHAYVHRHLGEEALWPLSMPCRLDGEQSIPIAHYGTSNIGMLKTVYRRGLAWRYGRIMQSIAGTHYNFSLPDTFWRQWQQQLGDPGPLADFRTQQYFWLIRNFRRQSWLLMYLFGASPALDTSFMNGSRSGLAPLGDRTLFQQGATSLRMSDLGYNNQAQSSLDICFNRLETYTDTLENAIHTTWPPYQEIGLFRDGERIQINDSVLQIENEYYSAIRPKRTTESGEKPLHALQERGVEYVEVRCLDLDPFSAVGVNEDQLDFMDLFLLHCLVSDSPLIDDNECESLDNAFQDVVRHGRDPDARFCFGAGAEPLAQAGHRILDQMGELAAVLPGAERYQAVLATMRARLDDPAQTPSGRLLSELGEGRELVDWGLAKASAQQAQVRAQATDDWDAHLAEQARQSLADQKAVEDAESEDFETFLARYLAE